MICRDERISTVENDIDRIGSDLRNLMELQRQLRREVESPVPTDTRLACERQSRINRLQSHITMQNTAFNMINNKRMSDTQCILQVGQKVVLNLAHKVDNLNTTILRLDSEAFVHQMQTRKLYAALKQTRLTMLKSILFYKFKMEQQSKMIELQGVQLQKLSYFGFKVQVIKNFAILIVLFFIFQRFGVITISKRERYKMMDAVRKMFIPKLEVALMVLVLYAYGLENYANRYSGSKLLSFILCLVFRREGSNGN